MMMLSTVLTYPCHSSSCHALGARLFVISLAEYLRLLFSCYFSFFGFEKIYPSYRFQRTSGDLDASLGSLIEVLSSFVGLFWLMSLH